LRLDFFAFFFFATFLAVFFLVTAFLPAVDFDFFPDFFAVFLAAFFAAFFEDDLPAVFAVAFFGGVLADARFAAGFRFFFGITTGIIGAEGIRGSIRPSPATGMKTTCSPGFTGSGSIACCRAADAVVAMFSTASLILSTNLSGIGQSPRRKRPYIQRRSRGAKLSNLMLSLLGHSHVTSILFI
jgi:hypothetical protein